MEFTIGDFDLCFVYINYISFLFIKLFLSVQRLVEDVLQRYDESVQVASYSTDLRVHIRDAMEKEASYYLEYMDTVVQYGWSYLRGKLVS